MTSRMPLVLGLSFLGGVLAAVQSRMNGELALHLGNGIVAALYSFTSGLVILGLVLLARPEIRAALARLRARVRAGTFARWQLLGGLLGAFMVAVQSTVVPVVGVAVFLVALVAGQSSTSLLVDRTALSPAGKRPITAPRLVSAGLGVLAVVVAVAGRFSSGSLSVAALLFAVAAGAGVALQTAINGRVALAAGDPLAATLVNFVLGVVGLGVATGFVFLLRVGIDAPLLGAPWWAYLGGVVGAVYIAISAWAVPIVGVLVYALTFIAGQIVGALAEDIVLPTPGTQLSWNLFAAAALALVAAFVASRRRA